MVFDGKELEINETSREQIKQRRCEVTYTVSEKRCSLLLPPTLPNANLLSQLLFHRQT